MKRKIIVFTILIVFILICLFSANLIENKETSETHDITSSDVEKASHLPYILEYFYMTECKRKINYKKFFELYIQNVDNSKFINEFDTFVLLNKIYFIFSNIDYRNLVEMYKLDNGKYDLKALPILQVFTEKEKKFLKNKTTKFFKTDQWSSLRVNYKFFNEYYNNIKIHFSMISFLFKKSVCLASSITQNELDEKCRNLKPIFGLFETKYLTFLKDLNRSKTKMSIKTNNTTLKIDVLPYCFLTWYNLFLEYDKFTFLTQKVLDVD